jgi:hypothetical protein
MEEREKVKGQKEQETMMENEGPARPEEIEQNRQNPT